MQNASHAKMLQLAFWAVVWSVTGAWSSRAEAAATCPVGIYADQSESVILYDKMFADGSRQAAYVFIDGRRGVLGEGELVCKEGDRLSGSLGEYRKVKLSERDIRFTSGDIALAGRLISPTNADDRIRALTVFVHGSETTPTVGASHYPYLLAAQGITVFAYDKRGTGQSEGDYTQDFFVLADDAAAAFNEAKRIANGEFDHAGYFGGSQGGWVAPLAATKTTADFLVVGFGLVLSPVEEDAEQVYDEMRRAGYGTQDIEKARDVTAATGEIVASHFSSGFEALEAAKKKHRNESWLYEIEGEFTGSILNASEAELRSGVAGGFEDSNVRWRYDATAVLRSLTIPQLWVIAGEDKAAPGELTRKRLETLQGEGLPITTALFPNTDHGMVEFTETADGTRRYTRYAEGYFQLIADAMKSEYCLPYGKAEIVAPE